MATFNPRTGFRDRVANRRKQSSLLPNARGTITTSDDPSAIQSQKIAENARNRGVFISQSNLNRIGSPSSSNPVISTPSPIKTADQTATFGSTPTTSTPASLEKKIAPPVRRESFAESPAVPTSGLSPSQQALHDAGLPDLTTESQQRQNRAFFNELSRRGLTQQDLLDATGSTDALLASKLARGQGVGAAELAGIQSRLTEIEGQRKIAESEGRLKTEEEQIREDVRRAFAPQVEAAQRAAGRASETAFRIAGRGAAGTKSEIKQEELGERARIIQEGIAAEQRLDERRLLAQARGASDAEIESINEQISNARATRVKAEEDLKLRQAGLDEDALNRAAEKNEFDKKMMLDALESGFEYDPEQGTFTAQEGRTKIDQQVSKLLGFASDEFGNPVNGTDGKPLTIQKDSDIQWDSYKDKYGNNVFFDKNNPSNIFKPGGTSVFTSPDGSPSSSPTSNDSNSESLGIGDTYIRDDGTQGNLGENCVKWARENVPNLPFGLVNKQDKINAINFATEQGFGNRGGKGAKVGDAILTSEGAWGHAAVVTGVDEQTGELILAEANYKPGQVTQGRRISMDDPSIYGFVSSKDQPQMSSVINESGKSEGFNPAIETLVGVQTGQIPNKKFSSKEKSDFNKFIEDDKLPSWVRSESDEAKFMKDLAIFDNQPPEITPEQQKLATNAKEKNRIALNTIDSILNSDLISGAGLSASLTGRFAGSLTEDLQGALDTIISNIALEEMKLLKEASPTGSTGFGALNEKELAILTSGKGSLKVRLSEDQLKKNLQNLKNSILKVNGKIDEGVTSSGTTSAPSTELESVKNKYDINY